MALNQQMLFRRGDVVEVASQKQGFRGSYFVATVVMALTPVREYVVEYETLVTNDLSGPLREVVPAAEVRPVPPGFRMRDSGEFRKGDKVDAYDNEAWWAGEIIGKVGDKYKVYFDDSKEEIAYTVDLLRVHLDWIHLRAKWVDSFGRALAFQFV
ncbi:protein AGENET DOMAIN (AGD)-CONTAINING P1-like [Ipomoea triloba]|uniref:protein AGENET DOMAIN (AGD)-CONTAINING P1-like n=1 Tax=Ipomoea triloba TaxID=35885 RepID=UPI00125DDF66|nr:protein AGENET DOMAIN (AGD)-CONTAINING P1-like [Ipomoea triloba]